MTKMMIIGADGQLGSDLSLHFVSQYEIIKLTIDDVDITQMESVADIMEKYKPNLVINTAAFHKVDECEIQALRSFDVNTIGVKNLAVCARKIGAKLIHISTDYIFDGEKKSPYTEDDLPKPLNIYSISKLAGEYCVANEMEDYIVARVSGIYGIHRCMAKGGNFINTMMSLYRAGREIKVVDDEILTPTSTIEICRQLDVMIKNDLTGLYHLTNEGHCSWYEFAKEIFNILDIKIKITPVPASVFRTPFKRPDYSVLENKRLNEKKLNIMKDWKIALQEFLTQTVVEEL